MGPAEIMMLEGGGPRLALRRRRAEGAARGAILFVHGATLASELYDIPAEGHSWMAAAASADREAFAVDLRGYGRSEKPPCMAGDPAAALPYARAAEVLDDIDRAVDAAREAAGADWIDLVGGSWGSITCGLYAATRGATTLRRLILFAPIFAARNEGWLEITDAPGDWETLNPALGAYRWTTEADLRRRWDAEIRSADKTATRPEPVFRALVDAALAADPRATERDPPAFRSPNGTLVDLHAAFTGRPLYDPAAIAAPTLLIRGADDPTSTHDDASRLFDRLGAATKQYVAIGGATHFAIAERAAARVFAAAEAFLSVE